MKLSETISIHLDYVMAIFKNKLPHFENMVATLLFGLWFCGMMNGLFILLIIDEPIIQSLLVLSLVLYTSIWVLSSKYVYQFKIYCFSLGVNKANEHNQRNV